MDFSKVFDTVPHQRLIIVLDYYGIHGHHKVWLTNWLTRREQTVVVDGVSSPPFHVSSAVPQGTVLGRLMFLLYTNDICSDCSSTIRLFADDIILCSIVESTSDAKHLQSDLSTIERRSQKWLMQFNPSKCFVMRITRKCEPVIFYYKLIGHTLESALHYPYLGVELSSTLDWSHYIDNKVNKATALNQLKN